MYLLSLVMFEEVERPRAAQTAVFVTADMFVGLTPVELTCSLYVQSDRIRQHKIYLPSNRCEKSSQDNLLKTKTATDE